MRSRDEDERDRQRERALRIAARAGAQGGMEEEARAIGFLCSLDPAELVRVLAQVFAEVVPFPNETRTHISRSKYYLGIAYADRTSLPNQPPEWGPWRIEAAAYHQEGSERSCSGDSLHNEGQCPACKVRYRSNDSLMVCPICGLDPWSK